MSSPLSAPLDHWKQRDFRKRLAAHPPRPIERLEPRRLFAAGDLDPTFGQGGYVINYDDVKEGEIRDVAVQSDGQTVALVDSFEPGDDLVVERYNRDGTLDKTFSGDGRASFDFGLEGFAPVALALSGNKIVVAGAVGVNFGVARLNADGSLDASFDDDGKRTVAAPNAAPMEPGSLAVQSNGKIVLAGAAQRQFAALRLNADGSNDSSFHGDGYRQIDLSGSAEMANAVVIQGDGKIALGGYATGASTTIISFGIVRLEANGTLDNAFSGDGRKTTIFAGQSRINDLAIQADGKIVAVGFGTGRNAANAIVNGIGMVRYNANGSEDGSFGNAGVVSPTTNAPGATRVSLQGSKILVAARSGVTRYTPAGQVDTSFGTGGTSTVRFYSGFSAKGLATAPDGNIVISGQVGAPEGRVPGLARLNSDGTRDGNFGINGQVTPGGNVLFPAAEFQDVVVQTDGKVIAVLPAGTLQTNTDDILLVRYNTDGTLDSTFGVGGRLTLDFGDHENGAVLVLQGDGKILVLSRSPSATTLVRLNTNGGFDNSFSGDGKQTVAVTLTSLPAVVVAPDGKIVVGGATHDSISTPESTFVRYNADGTLDTSFGSGGTGRVTVSEWVLDFGVQRNGSVVALLYVNDPFTGVARRIVRFKASGGELDSTFVSSEASMNLQHNPFMITAQLVVQADDKIVVGHTYQSDASTAPAPAVFRLNADGTKDIRFGSGGSPVFGTPDQNVWLTDVAVQPDGKVLLLSARSPRSAPGGSGGVKGWALHRADAFGNHDTTFGTNGTVLLGDGLSVGDHRPQIALTPNGQIVVATYMPNPSYVYKRPAIARYLVGPLQAQNLPGVRLEGGGLSFLGTEGDDVVSVWADDTGGIVIWVNGQTQRFDASDVQAIGLSGLGGNDYLKIHPQLAIRAELFGGAGDDRLIGGAGNDVLRGDDWIRTENDGNDHLTGNGGDDHLDGGFGADVLRGGNGHDTLSYATRVNPVIVGIDGFQDDGEVGENDFVLDDIERIEGGGANDKLGGGSGNHNQVFYGGPGNDTIYGGGGNDKIFGEAGHDRLGGGDGDDWLEGGAGHDALYGDGGIDTLMGLAGNDRLFSDGDRTRDYVSGGTGTDSADVDELDDDLSGIETFFQ